MDDDESVGDDLVLDGPVGPTGLVRDRGTVCPVNPIQTPAISALKPGLQRSSRHPEFPSHGSLGAPVTDRRYRLASESRTTHFLPIKNLQKRAIFSGNSTT